MLIVSSIIVLLGFEKKLFERRLREKKHADSLEPKTWEQTEQPHMGGKHTQKLKRFLTKGELLRLPAVAFEIL